MYQLQIGHGLSKSTLTVLDDVIEAPRDVQMMIEPLQIFNPPVPRFHRPCVRHHFLGSSCQVNVSSCSSALFSL
jgi:hypothetical protein